jgi:aryl-alcohol dehydrogenase-like predicted oxidoreductase
MQQRTLGPFTVSAIGLGAMPVSMNNDRRYPEHDAAVEMVHAALDAGVTLIDTADIYAPDDEEMGHNERIVRDALRSWSGDTSGVVVATKGGITRTPDGGKGRDGSLEYLRSAARASVENLGLEVIDVYQYHRPDRTRVYADVMANLATLLQDGLVRTIGISNANVEEIAIARDVLGDALVSVQNEFSPRHPGSIDELRYCDEHGLAFLPWSPLGGIGNTDDPGNVFVEIGQAHDASPQQVVLAWELALGPHVVPIPGSSRPATIQSSARAVEIQLTDDEIARLSA